MKLDIYLNKAANIFAENRLLKFAILSLAITQIIVCFVIYAAVRYKETVLIPPNFSEKVSIKRGIPDDTYTEKAVRDIMNLALTYSPATVRWQFNELLKYYAPEEYPQASKFYYNLADTIESTMVSSVFQIRNILLKPAKKEITVSGDRKQYVDDRIINSTRIDYRLGYEYRRGRFTLYYIKDKGDNK